MTISNDARALLQEVLGCLHPTESAQFPAVQEFRLSHEAGLRVIDELISSRHLEQAMGRYALTLKGLHACESGAAKSEVEACDALLPVLKDAYRSEPARVWSAEELAQRAHRSAREVGKNLTFLIEQPMFTASSRDQATGLVSSVRLAENVVHAAPIGWPDEHCAVQGDAAEPDSPSIETIEISGYRPFDRFQAAPEKLTLVIGANASGKSSLFDFLRFVSFGASNPLPPEIDPQSAGKTLFHVGGPERIDFALVVAFGQRKLLRYEGEIQGPVGTPRILRERLATTEPLTESGREPFVFLDFRGGKGVVRDQMERGPERPTWTVPPNELALRRALDPTLLTLSRFQTFLASWRFFSGFDVSGSAAVRRPVPTEPTPNLAEDGSNLSAVLFWLMTEHIDAWQELETHLRSAIPGFSSLNVKPRGGPGTVIGVWREHGLKDELTLADLSDGTLRLLCWATLCLSPSIPPVVCIDEPELGLHPRVLPMLAGLLRLASTRSQLLVATHSPYFLAQFGLDEIAVMRKEGGCAQFVRPRTSEALRREVAELGGDALAQLHISDELEVRP